MIEALTLLFRLKFKVRDVGSLQYKVLVIGVSSIIVVRGVSLVRH